MQRTPSTEEMRTLLRSARARTLALVSDLDEAQMLGPMLRIVNPLRWELGHVGWFQERWTQCALRRQEPLLAEGDALYDSAKVAHDSRWDLPLPSIDATLRNIETILERALDSLGDPMGPDELYFHLLALFHEDMHAEAFAYTRQTLGYPAPPTADRDGDVAAAGSAGGRALAEETAEASADVQVPGGPYSLGARREPEGAVFVFDNEKWAHEVGVSSFRMARCATTQAEFAAFVDDFGYQRREFWSDGGWDWRERKDALHPLYWRRTAGRGSRWQRRHFDRWLDLEARGPVRQVCYWEAEAFCNWAGRRLPTEAEWELAAGGFEKRYWPWGDAPPEASRATLDARGARPVDAGEAGASPFGCLGMMGNVWEWTSSWLGPFPGFVRDPYKEYSEPWFHTHKVLRGGSWLTRSRLVRCTWRNFYTPDRRDVMAGFRTVAKEA
jgi:iron(II)-dependent oxidoreductase